MFIVVYIIAYVLTSILYNICGVLITSTPVMTQLITEFQVSHNMEN